MALSLGRLFQLGSLPESLRNDIDLAIFYTHGYISAALNALRRGETMEDIRRADSFSKEAAAFAKQARELIVRSLNDPEARERLKTLVSVARKGVLFGALRKKVQAQLQGLGDDLERNAVTNTMEMAEGMLKILDEPTASKWAKSGALTRAKELLYSVRPLAKMEGPGLLHDLDALVDRVNKLNAALLSYEAPMTFDEAQQRAIDVKVGTIREFLKELKDSVRNWGSGKPIISFLKFRSILPGIVEAQREKLRQEGYTEDEILEMTLGPEEIRRLRKPETIRVDDENRTIHAPFSLKQALQRFPFSELESRRSILEKLYNASGVLNINMVQEAIARQIAELEQMDPKMARIMKDEADLLVDSVDVLRRSNMPPMPEGLGLLILSLMR